jgi:mono/diheme cytochrome c family protein
MTRFTSIALLLGLTAIGMAACGDSAPPVSAPDRFTIAEPGPIPVIEQQPGDPAAGYRTVVNRGYMTCGIPYDAFRSSGLMPTGERRLSGREGLSAELPYMFNSTVNRDGVDLVVSNCLTCHASEFEGELVIGLGNPFLDFTNDPSVNAELLGAFVEDGAPAAAWAKWADRIAAIAPYMVTDTVGVNPAPNLTLALIAHRDPATLAWHSEPLLEPPPRTPLPTKVPPWWRMQHKAAMFYNGSGRGDHVRYMMMKSLVCTDDIEEAAEIADWFKDVRAFIASLEPPAYPFPVEMELAAEGEQVFARVCAGCHGSYGAEQNYPNLLIDLETVGTDPAYARQAVESERFVRWFNRSFYGQGAEAMPALGYVAPPLDGVWATAPYLHNGSIPSIAAVLDSTQRPTYWQMRTEPRRYDPDTLGWRFDVLESGKEAVGDPELAKRIYDTTRHGYGNQGHTFGDTLSEQERRSLIEYLKTL